MKQNLDLIFDSEAVLENELSVAQAGFKLLYKGPASRILLLAHPLLPGYLLKAYLNKEEKLKNGYPGWVWLCYRCEGAQRIRKIISKKKLKYFTVPGKWLYPLSLSGSAKQPVVLLVEDMKIASEQESFGYWNNLTDKVVLNELFMIIKQGCGSSQLPCNVPFSKKENKFAFIDTEYPDRKPNYLLVREFLNHEMKEYWDLLIKKKKK